MKSTIAHDLNHAVLWVRELESKRHATAVP